MNVILEDPTITAYEGLAPFYDQWSHGFQHSAWLANIEAIAIEHGLRGKHLLDMACGTGKSFMPMLERGYDVVGVDISPPMARQARERVGARAQVLVADIRDLPPLGSFDLVTCLNDALNYLLSEQELRLAFDSAARNLRPGGLFVFDLNTLGCYRRYFRTDRAVEIENTFFCWRGNAGEDEVLPGAMASAVIEVFSSEGDDLWKRRSSRHVQRHHPPDDVARLLGDAGLELVARRGHVTGKRLDPGGDEDLHMKLDYFARKPATSRRYTKGVKA